MTPEQRSSHHWGHGCSLREYPGRAFVIGMLSRESEYVQHGRAEHGRDRHGPGVLRHQLAAPARIRDLEHRP